MRAPLAALLLLAQAAQLPSPDGVVEDVRRLSASITNEQRHEALTDILSERGIPFRNEPFTIDTPLRGEPRTEGQNVVVTLGPGSGRGDVVIGAHYDAVRLQPDRTLSRGAVDNAASTVMLIYLADALRRERLRQRVHVVWFDMEELGLIGSARFLEAHRGMKIAAMINFDINAYGDTVLFGQPPGGESEALRRTMMRTCAETQVDCIRFASLPPSDDRTFGKAGIPTISLARLPAVEAHQLWLLLQGGTAGKTAAPPPILDLIHTADDQPERVDGRAILDQQRLALALVRNVLAGR